KPGRAERMDVGMPRAGPVLEFDAQLEGRLDLAYEIILIDAERHQVGDDRRDGRLPDPDGADLGGLDQPKAATQAIQVMGEGRGGHPTRSSSPDDRDSADGIDWHLVCHGNATRASVSTEPAVASAISRNSADGPNVRLLHDVGNVGVVADHGDVIPDGSDLDESGRLLRGCRAKHAQDFAT